VEAREQMNNLSEEAKLHYEKLDKILLETKGAEIYSLIEFLDALGFRIAIAPKINDDGVVSARSHPPSSPKWVGRSTIMSISVNRVSQPNRDSLTPVGEQILYCC
jgi:hypothetical protein